MCNTRALVTQGIIKGLIRTVKLYGFQESARAIAEDLPGNSAVEKLTRLELGDANRRHVEHEGMVLVILEQCPFGLITQEIPEWGEEEERIVKQFNAHPGGGGALHPICILHCYIRESVGEAYNLACRSKAGEVAVAAEIAEHVGLTVERLNELVDGNACVYAIVSE